MPLEARTVVSKGIGSLAGCLVEGDPEQRVRERKVRGRALTASLISQAILLAVLLIVPLFAKVPVVPGFNFVPIPPYHHSAARTVSKRQPDFKRPRICVDCVGLTISPIVPILRERGSPEPISDDSLNIGPIPGQPNTSGPDAFDPRRGIQPPPPPSGPPRIRKGGIVQAAMLVYRVEPVYPILMKQIRKSGRVELRAIISTDGTMESLQVISGDAGFFQSALDAVRQWRYKPTILNGQPVEVETNITVIYNVGQ